MTAKLHLSNPLALAVLALLYEQPMHPYQVATTLRERGKHESIKLNYGSLYTVIESLQRKRLIAEQETLRDSRRPERTVYCLTDAGREAFLDWLRELVRTPQKEYTQFAAGLSFLPALPPAEAIALLDQRVQLLAGEVADIRDRLEAAIQEGLPRLFLIELEHEHVLREAELRWVREMAGAMADGTLSGMQEWRSFHPGLDALDAAGKESKERS